MVRTNLQEFAGDVHVLSNLQVGSNLFANDLAANVLNVIGSIGANLFVGDGGLLSNIATTLDDIIDQGNTVSNTIIFVSGNDATSNTGIITRSNVGISISNTEPTGEYQLTVGSNIFVNTHASNVLTVVGRIGSDYFVGDGGLLSNIATTLDQIVDQGNTISNTVILESGQDSALTSNIGLVSRENVGISVSNSNPTGEFQFGVGSNLFVNTYSSNVLTVEGNVLAQKLTFGTATVTSAYNLSHVTAQGSVTDQTISLTNATTGLAVTSNATVGGNVTAETVISTANVEVGDRLKFASNVFVDDLRVADVAANLVTYDKTTGELMDSGGLFANKLAVVSVQPPSALSANTTTIAKHGTYTVTTSGLAEYSNAWNAFDGDSAVEWTSPVTYGEGDGVYSGTSNLFAGNYIQTGVSSAGEWLAIEFPYKTTLRHMKLTPPATATSYPTSANVYATNDSLTWTEVVNWSDVNPGDQQSNVQTIIVNATESFKKYAMVVTKAVGTTTSVALAKWDLFTESFSIDGGKVEMATSAVMGGETTMDQHGPHSRNPKAVPLKKYPEIVFEDGKFDRNDSTNTYVQAGYTVTASSQYPDRFGWEAFNDTTAEWLTADNTYATDGSYLAGGATFSSNGVDYTGNWLKIKLPNRVNIKKINITSYDKGTTSDDRRPKTGVFLGSNDDSSWEIIHRFNDDLTWNGASATGISTITNISNLNLYKYILLVVEEIQPNTVGKLTIREIEYYGYEEDPPTGDTSVDTTFTSIMNTPQTTGANVYVDGNLGETFTNRVTGPDATGTSATYDATGKYWELNGSLESNIAVEANTFLSGDAPHSVSVWFNSSNLEANVSNTCVFSVSDQEKLDSQNLDLQSNTWHNLTYAYQGEGGSKVTYLDGRKVAEDQAEDTFGEYPPFAMTGYSQGGYVVSASSEYVASYPPWKAFDNSWHNNGDTDGSEVWLSENATNYGGTDGLYNRSPPRNLGTGALDGEWIKIEMPHKIKLDYIKIYPRLLFSSGAPRDFIVYGSNDNVNWSPVLTETGASITATHEETGHTFSTDVHNTCYKYFGLVIRKLRTATTFINIAEIKFYGHRENDLVRLPDPTNVLKYPHIAMTGPAQRGYVASASNGNGYPAFDNSTSTAWTTNYGTGYDTTSPYAATTNAPLFEGVRGDWIKLQLPRKLIVQRLERNASANRRPATVNLYGLDDDSTWTLISGGLTFENTQLASASVNATVGYKEFVFQVTNLSGSDSATFAKIFVYYLNFYGTEENSSIPIQIGGGNIDKVANFRVYDKFVGEDQALEIWDAQKDEFGRAKSSMTLQKGRLGIGTTEPEGRLAVVDEPHNLEEFPPRAMTGYKTYFEGYGEFCVRASNVLSENYTSYKAFNKNSTATTGNWWTQSDTAGEPAYSASTGEFSSTDSHYSTNVEGATKFGQWIQIEFPYKINYRYSDIQAPQHSIGRQPRAGYIVGSNDLSGMWTSLHRFTNVTRTHPYESVIYTPPTVSTQTFKYFRLVVEETNNYEYAGIARWDIFGTREQGQSVLHDGQLTLTKNLDVPRIGPALDADDTPRRDRLVVEYNTSTNPTFEGAVRDTSGRGNDGVLVGGVSYSGVGKALEFDGNGSDDYITSTIKPSIIGEFIHSFSIWLNFTALEGTYDYPIFIGSIGALNQTSILRQNSSGQIGPSFGSGYNLFTNFVPNTNQWYHMVVVYRGGAVNATNVDYYIDGVKQSITGTGTGTLAIDENVLSLGDNPGGGNPLKGSLSNFKLYDTALTAEEVKTLYDMGRLGSVANPQPLHIAAPLYSPGTIVQVEQAVKTDTSAVTSTSVVDIGGLSVDITPKFSTSKILVSYIVNVGVDITGTSNMHGFLRVKRTQGGISTYIGDGASSGDRQVCTSYIYNTANSMCESFSFEHLDDANGTGTVTYTIQGLVESGVYTMTINRSGSDGDNGYYGRTTSSITVKEVCQ